METLRKFLKYLLLVLLIFLACFGIGLTGAAPIFPKNRRKGNYAEIKTELVEKKKKDNARILIKEIL